MLWNCLRAVSIFAGAGFLKPAMTYDKQEAPSIYPIMEEAGYTIARGLKEYEEKVASAKNDTPPS